jgi:hypothetical protein
MGDYKPGQLGSLLGSAAAEAQPAVADLFSQTKYKRTETATRISAADAADVARILSEAEKRHQRREREADPNRKNKKEGKERKRPLKSEREAGAEPVVADDSAAAAAAAAAAAPRHSKKRQRPAAEREPDSDDSDDGPQERAGADSDSEDDAAAVNDTAVGVAAAAAPIKPAAKKPGVRQEDGPDKDARTVFVGNVNVTTKMPKIKSFFKEYGAVESVRLRSVAVEGIKVSLNAAFEILIHVTAS